jgi:hypothetical protein
MLIDDLSSGSMPDLYTAVGGECGAVDLQHEIVTKSRAALIAARSTRQWALPAITQIKRQIDLEQVQQAQSRDCMTVPERTGKQELQLAKRSFVDKSNSSVALAYFGSGSIFYWFPMVHTVHRFSRAGWFVFGSNTHLMEPMSSLTTHEAILFQANIFKPALTT